MSKRDHVLYSIELIVGGSDDKPAIIQKVRGGNEYKEVAAHSFAMGLSVLVEVHQEKIWHIREDNERRYFFYTDKDRKGIREMLDRVFEVDTSASIMIECAHQVQAPVYIG